MRPSNEPRGSAMFQIVLPATFRTDVFLDGIQSGRTTPASSASVNAINLRTRQKPTTCTYRTLDCGKLRTSCTEWRFSLLPAKKVSARRLPLNPRHLSGWRCAARPSSSACQLCSQTLARGAVVCGLPSTEASRVPRVARKIRRQRRSNRFHNEWNPIRSKSIGDPASAAEG